MTKVTTYHRRRPNTSPRSAAKTPIWQVNDDAMSTNVTGTASARFSSVGGRRPLVGLGASGEVHREQAGEEHQLTGQPHDRPDGDHVWSIE